MTIWLIMIPALIAGHPGATTPHWHHRLSACRADERAHHMLPGSCLPPPAIDLDSAGATP